MKSEVIYLHRGRGDVSLTTYVQDNSPELLNGKTRPAVLICPGGAYMSCSDREGEPVAMQFAAMGYHAFVLRYSVYNEGKPGFPDLGVIPEPKEHCKHPNPMRDIALAMLTIREHAKDWLVDVDRIALCGFSAGAHNCAMYATNWHKPVITEYFGKDAEIFRPAAAILCYALTDYVYMRDSSLGDPMAEGLFMVSNAGFLGEARASEDMLVEVSPARNVTEFTPPTFLWATSQDSLVPVQHSVLMAKALADQHIPFELHIFESGPHGLAVGTQASAGALSEINPDAAKWVPLCNAWLLKRFALKLPRLNAFESMMQEKMGK